MGDRDKVRDFVLGWSEDHFRELTKMSDQIWLYAEPLFRSIALPPST